MEETQGKTEALLALSRAKGERLGFLLLPMVLLLTFPFLYSLYNWIVLRAENSWYPYSLVPLLGSVLSVVALLMYGFAENVFEFLSGVFGVLLFRAFALSGLIPYFFSIYLVALFGLYRLYLLTARFTLIGLLGGIFWVIIGCALLKFLDMYTRVISESRVARRRIMSESSERAPVPRGGEILREQNVSRVESADPNEARFMETAVTPSAPITPAVPGPLPSQAEQEAKQEQLEERERIGRLSKLVEAFVKRFGGDSDQERQHLFRLLTEEGLIAGEGNEPQRSIDVGLAENFITAVLQAQDRNRKSAEHELFKGRLTATTQPAEEQKSPGPSEDAIFLAMGQRADTIRTAYVKLMERRATGYFRSESELPASKDSVKAAIVLTAWCFKLEGKLDKGMYGAYRNAYAHLADFVSDELVARPRKEAELRGQVPPTHPGLVPKWKAIIVMAAWIFKSQGKLEEHKKYRTLGEEYQRLGEQFIVLCDEFGRRLEALDDPSKMANEKKLIQKTLLPETIGPGGEHEPS